MIRYRVLALALAGGRTPCRMRNLEDEDGRPRPSEALHQQGGSPRRLCGIVEVWENRQAQAGRRISLKVVVLPGARRGENPDPLFYLAGGLILDRTSLPSALQSPV